MKFISRWKIEGTLTTLSPLRVGDGDSIEAKKRLNSTYLKADTEINTVATDKKGKPYIPASSIKGSLRAWADNSSIIRKEEIDILFGSANPKELCASAGKIQFSNAYCIGSTDDFSELADWSPKRLTAVSVGIAIDRKSRTASDKKLFHQEYVPSEISFRFSLSGNDYEVTDDDEQRFLRKIEDYPEEAKKKAIEEFKKYRRENNGLLKDPGLIKLITLLEAFNSNSRPVCIGAETVESDGSWGRMEWNLGAIKRTYNDDIKSWFENDEVEPLSGILQELDAATKNFLEDAAKKEVNSVYDQMKEMSVSLQCLDDFLVNDPSKVKSPDEIEQNDPKNKKPNHSPLRNKDGHPILPKSSIKGAIRSQAERILRTMAISAGCSEDKLKMIACCPDNTENACKPIKTIEDVKNLCLVCQLFGAPGWKSPMNFTDFTGIASILVEKIAVGDEEKLVPKRREFVAIDRFTGGVSGSGKFNAEVAHRPKLEGKISFDRSRLDEEWAVGLLALTFRDLIEGDIRLGFGRAKGFGEVSAKINGSESIDGLFGETREELIRSVEKLEAKIAEVI